MGKIRTIISIIFICLMGIGWLVQGKNVVKNNIAYANYNTKAEEYMEKGLYQKAIQSYQKALELKEKKKTRNNWIKAYEESVKDDTNTSRDYADALYEACKKYPKESIYWEKLLNVYIETNDYKSANSYYKKSQNAGAKSDKLKELGIEITYSFTVDNKNYEKIFQSPDGYFTVFDGNYWGVLDADGKWIYECEYMYASPCNSEGMAMYTSTKGNRLIGKDSVVENILDNQLSIVGCYGDSLLPVLTENENWQYYDINEGTYVLNNYAAVSGFSKSIAAVQEGDKWYLIDTKGEKESKTEFENIKLYGNGAYTYDGIMVAAENGVYGIYDSKGEKQADLKCKDADIYMGGSIAFQGENGKWGFVDKSGKEVIEPKYKAAKSFSNGLAGVYDGEMWGFINEKGELVIDYQFLDIGYFTKKGLCSVSSYADLFYMIKLRF